MPSRLYLICLVTALLAAAGGCQGASPPYRVHCVPDASIRIDGQLDEPAWLLAEPLTGFCDPWRGGALPTEFRAFCDNGNLHFAFTVRDDSLKLETSWRGQKTLDDEDRVEIYFALDGRLEKYYCIEIDPVGRVHDFAGSFPRKWDDTWAMPGLKTAGRIFPGGYVVEGSIPLAALESLGLPPLRSGGRWRMGLFRADLEPEDSGSVHWITWIVPRTANPDFHTPGAFGAFQYGQTRYCRQHPETRAGS